MLKSFRIIFFYITLLFACCILTGQVEEVDPPSDIKTITFGSQKDISILPIINLNERIYLEFDVLNNLEEDLYYVIEHFDYDWTPSRLMKSEYLDGMDNLRIFNYERLQ